jgi:RND family efflux transporter MFP subunit
MFKPRSPFFVKLFTASAVVFRLMLASPLLLVACSNNSHPAAQQAAAPAAPQISVAEVLQRQITDYQEFTGYIEAVERVELRPRVSGYIESVNFHEGGAVQKGEVLFVIDARPYDAVHKRALAELARARSALRQMQTEYERAVKLLAVRALSQEEVEASKANHDKAAADVQAAQAAVDAAALDLAFTQVRSPITGIAGKADITVGNFVSRGDSVLTRLVSVDPVYVRFEGDELAYAKQRQVLLAAPATPNVWVGLAHEQGQPHAGTLVFMDNELNAATGTVSARALLSNSDHLFTPGMFARVKLAEGDNHEALLIRDSAIGTDQNRRYVWVVSAQNVIEYRAVELGVLVEGLREVRSGLQAGENIVVNGLHQVRPGMPINPERVAMGGDASSSMNNSTALAQAGETAVETAVETTVEKTGETLGVTSR